MKPTAQPGLTMVADFSSSCSPHHRHFGDLISSVGYDAHELTLLFGNGLSQRARLLLEPCRLNEEAQKYRLGSRAQKLLSAVPDLMPEDALRYLRGYPIAYEPSQLMRSEYNLLRQAYTNALVAVHPERPSPITEQAVKDISSFFGSFSALYTTNYDLLASWALNQRPQRNYLTDQFQGYTKRHTSKASLFMYSRQHRPSHVPLLYLHGGLHLLQDGDQTKKLVRRGTGTPLREHIRHRINDGFEPMIVLEGGASRKIRKIMRNAYLRDVFHRFKNISGTLVTYGWGVNLQDRHLIDAILRNQSLSGIWISVHGEINSPENQEMQARISRQLAAASEQRTPAEIIFYDAASVPF